MGVVVFDICGTLYNSNTTFEFCYWVEKSKIKRLALKCSRNFIGIFLNKASVFLFNCDFLKKIHISSLAGYDETSLNLMADTFVKSQLRSKRIEAVHAVLNEIQSGCVVLASASINPVVKSIASELNISEFYSSKLSFIDGICNGKLLDDLLGKKNSIFSNDDIDLVVTDNRSDVSLCSRSAECIIVSNKKNLKFWQNANINVVRYILTE